MKVLEIIKIRALKPRDPNYRIMQNKANAAGKMRDKRRDQKNGEYKHPKKEELLEAVRMPYRIRIQGNFGHVTTKWNDIFLPYSDLDIIEMKVLKDQNIIRDLIAPFLAKGVKESEFNFSIADTTLSFKDKLLKIKIKYTLPALPERSATLLIRD